MREVAVDTVLVIGVDDVFGGVTALSDVAVTVVDASMIEESSMLSIITGGASAIGVSTAVVNAVDEITDISDCAVKIFDTTVEVESSMCPITGRGFSVGVVILGIVNTVDGITANSYVAVEVVGSAVDGDAYMRSICSPAVSPICEVAPDTVVVMGVDDAVDGITAIPDVTVTGVAVYGGVELSIRFLTLDGEEK